MPGCMVARPEQGEAAGIAPNVIVCQICVTSIFRQLISLMSRPWKHRRGRKRPFFLKHDKRKYVIFTTKDFSLYFSDVYTKGQHFRVNMEDGHDMDYAGSPVCIKLVL